MKLSEIRKLMNHLPPATTPTDFQKRSEYLSALGFDPGMLYQELEMESRFVDAHQDTSFSNSSVTLHSHTFFELLFCCNTCGAEYLVETNRYRLQKGDIIFVPPGVSHRPLLPEGMHEPYRRYVLWISAEFLQQIQRQFPDEKLYQNTGTRLLRTAGTKWEFLGDMFARGVREAEQKAVGWEAALTGNTLQLIVQLRRAIIDRHAKPLKAEKPELLDQVLAYVEAHMAQRITLEETAKHFWVSQSTISQLFRNRMGVSFYRCVTQRRLIAAKTMIQAGGALESIAEKTGFSDYSTFYRAFKQEYGISPRQYRKMQQQSQY